MDKTTNIVDADIIVLAEKKGCIFYKDTISYEDIFDWLFTSQNVIINIRGSISDITLKFMFDYEIFFGTAKHIDFDIHKLYNTREEATKEAIKEALLDPLVQPQIREILFKELWDYVDSCTLNYETVVNKTNQLVDTVLKIAYKNLPVWKKCENSLENGVQPIYSDGKYIGDAVVMDNFYILLSDLTKLQKE